MTNAEIAQAFEKIALILDLKGDENPFRIRAYERAAMMIDALPKDLRTLYDEGGIDALKKLPGIGPDLAQKIEEMLRTGKSKHLESIMKKIPPGLLEIMAIEGLGPKKTKLLWQKFKVKSIRDLKKLAESGKLEKIKGWGPKSVENILRGIELKKMVGGRLPVHVAAELAAEIVEALKKSKLCTQIEIAGSLRRRRETVGDIDILATSDKPAKLMDVFCALPQVKSVFAKGPTKSTVFLNAGLDADLRVVDRDVFGAALHYFTGSKDHNVHIRRIGIRKGLTISEYGVYKGTAKSKGKLVAARTEQDVYDAVGLPFIAPEIREDRGEIEAAQMHALPKLITADDLYGDLHTHTVISDGSDSIAAMAKAAKDLGHEYIAITDHASPMGMVKGIKKENVKKFLAQIAEARKKVPGIHILAGTEVDILADGSLYLPDDVLKLLDIVVGSVHQHFRDSPEKTTKRLLTALRNPYLRILGHPTARLLGKRAGIEFDVEDVLKEAKKQGVALELNASPERLDLSDVHCKRAKDLGVKIAIDSDAHSVRGLDKSFGVAQARRGWLEKHDIINALSWAQFEKWLQKR